MARIPINPTGGAAEGLDLFAIAWIERWTAHGGSIKVATDSDAMFSFVPSPSHAREWEDGHFTGATRELLTLLEAVPGGREAVKAHVKLYPAGRSGSEAYL